MNAPALARSEMGDTEDATYQAEMSTDDSRTYPAAHPLPTPRTDAAIGKFTRRTYTEACICVDAEDMRTIEREAAELRAQLADMTAVARTNGEDLDEVRAQLAEVKEALAGDDYASLPSDYPLVRMAHTIRADHDKFRNQVIDTCTRAETAERQRDEARKGEERYQWVLPILTGEGHEGDKRALAIAAQLVNGLTGSAAIDAAKEKTNG